MSGILLFFVKNPVPGKVKTRLAQGVGEARAADVYAELAKTNYEIALRLSEKGIKTIVVFDPPESVELIRSWLPGAHDYWPQPKGGLGDRLEIAFQKGFAAKCGPVLALGSDTLGLSQELLIEALGCLDNSSAVIGPANDGGYYLLGLTKEVPGIFSEIEWSTSRVMHQTVEFLSKSKKSYQTIASLDDLDDMETYQKYRDLQTEEV